MSGFSVMDLINSNSKAEAVRDNERVRYDEIVPNEKNEFDLQAIEELAQSIATIGLEQNLVIKETDEPNVYLLVTGHRRLEAIKYIFETGMEIDDKIRMEIERPLCKIIPKNEDPLVTEIRLFETNMQARANKDYEMIGIIDKYLSLIQQAKEKGLLVNGKEVKGKTKEILAERFGISPRTAGKYTTILKAENEELKEKVMSGEMTVNSAYNQVQEERRQEEENKENKPKKKEKEENIYINDLANKIQSKLQTKVEIKGKKLSFHFADEEDLNGLLGKLGLEDIVNE